MDQGHPWQHIPPGGPLPVRSPAGVVRKTLASHIDLTPTVLDYFGVDTHGALEGASLLPVLRQPAAEAPATVVCNEFHRTEMSNDGFGAFQPIRCASGGRYKLVVNLMTTDELYDLQSDPGELTNRIDDPALAAARNRLHDEMLAWLNRTRDPFRGWYWERRPWRTDARPVTDWHYTAWTRQRPAEPDAPTVLDYDTALPPKAYDRKIPGVKEAQ